MLTHVCGLLKNSPDEPSSRAGIESKTYKINMWTWEWEGDDGMNWETRIDINILQCVNRELVGTCSKAHSAQCSVMS